VAGVNGTASTHRCSLPLQLCVACMVSPHPIASHGVTPPVLVGVEALALIPTWQVPTLRGNIFDGSIAKLRKISLRQLIVDSQRHWV
jgi:hypothetical protein